MLHVLMVCTGNMCRSPVAEHLVRATSAQDVVAHSAGTRATDGRPMDDHARQALEARLGPRDGEFRSRRLDAAMVAAADLILTSTRDHRSDVTRLAPQSLNKTFTLLELAFLARGGARWVAREPIAGVAGRRSDAAGQPLDIADPVGKPLEVHLAVVDETATAVDAMAERLRQWGQES